MALLNVAFYLIEGKAYFLSFMNGADDINNIVIFSWSLLTLPISVVMPNHSRCYVNKK